MARTYKRDSRGRFAGGGGGSSRGGGRKPLQRGTNRLTRDNAGRITSVGGDGATARGGRLRTASGKQRATVTARGIGKAPAGTVGRSGRVKAPARVGATTAQSKRRRLPASARPASTTPKPRGLEPGAISGKIKPRDAARRASQLRARADRLDATGNRLMGGGRNDRAATNVSLNSRARRNETAAGFRGLEMTRTAGDLRSRASGIEAKARESSAKALREAATPKRTRSAESLRMSRAKQVTKRRGMNISNPAGYRSDAAARMAANAARTQERATAFLKKQKRATAKPAAAAKPARRRAAVGKISEAKANRIVARIDANMPSRRAASGSARRTQNAIKTHRKASDFTLAAAARARRSGKTMTVAQSLQRAVSNAAKRRR